MTAPRPEVAWHVALGERFDDRMREYLADRLGIVFHGVGTPYAYTLGHRLVDEDPDVVLRVVAHSWGTHDVELALLEGAAAPSRAASLREKVAVVVRRWVEAPRVDDPELFEAVVLGVEDDLAFIRVEAGGVETCGRVRIVDSGEIVRVARLVSDAGEEVFAAFAGDIVGVAGIGRVSGRLVAADAPIAVFAATLSPTDGSDPIEVTAASEQQLEAAIERARSKSGEGIHVGRPRVRYEETIRSSAQRVEGRFVRAGGQFAVVYLDVEPAPGKGVAFASAVRGGAVPAAFVPAVEEGVRQAAQAGVLGGFPLGGVRVTLVDGNHHPVDSTAAAFRVAGAMALKEAARQASPVLLEPIGEVEILSPPQHVDAVTADLELRRARVAHDSRDTLIARVPLGEMLGYAEDLRRIIGHEARFRLTFVGYEEAPPHVAEHVLRDHGELMEV